MFYFRINKVHVFDNRESGFLFFKRDRAEVKFLSFVTTGDTAFPDLDQYIAETDSDRRKKLAAAMITQVISSRILATIDNVRDNQTIRFGDTGYVVFQTEKIPDDFNWCFAAVEDDEDIRRLGETTEAILNNPGFEAFESSLALLVGASANPTFTAAMAVTKFVAGIIAESFKNNKNDLVGLLYMSLNRREHYPHGERKRDDVPDLTSNMHVDYSMFGYED